MNIIFSTVEPPIKDTIEITRTRFNVPNGDLPIVLIIIFLTSDKGQPLIALNRGQNGQKTMGPKRVRYSEVPLYISFNSNRQLGTARDFKRSGTVTVK